MMAICVQECQTIYQNLNEELSAWKQANNHRLAENNLEQLEKWCVDLCYLIVEIRKQYMAMQRVTNNLECSQNTQHLEELLGELIKTSFVVKDQPPQVLRTNNKFSASVSLLVARALKIDIKNPSVSIIKDPQ